MSETDEQVRRGLMASLPHEEVTQLLLAWRQGEPLALEELIPVVHKELRRLAHRYMSGEREGHTLQTTALVNEAYVRLVDSSQVQWQNRAHFFAMAAQLMRRVLVDFARTRNYQKRGGEVLKVEFDEAWMGSTGRGVIWWWHSTMRCRNWRSSTPGRARWWRCGSLGA